MGSVDFETLSAVLDKISRHPVTGALKRLPSGVDGVSTENFLGRREHHLKEILRLLNAPGGPRYKFGPLLRLEKPKDTGGVRLIHIPRIRDQVVLRLIHDNLLQAATLHGIDLRVSAPQKVVAKFREALKSFADPVIVRTDITKFYDSIPRAQVVERATEFFPATLYSDLLRVWSEKIMARPLFVAGTSFDLPVAGLPQGLSISSSLSEVWGKQIDEKLSGKFLFYRYVDDITLVCPNHADASAALKHTARVLNELGLKLSESKTKIETLKDGVTWLGLKHFSDSVQVDDDRVHRWLRKFARMRREAVKNIATGQDRHTVVTDYLRAVDLELSGRTGSKVGWFSLVTDTAKWNAVDKALHNMIRSVHRAAGMEYPAEFPSVSRAIMNRKKRIADEQ